MKEKDDNEEKRFFDVHFKIKDYNRPLSRREKKEMTVDIQRAIDGVMWVWIIRDPD